MINLFLYFAGEYYALNLHTADRIGFLFIPIKFLTTYLSQTYTSSSVNNIKALFSRRMLFWVFTDLNMNGIIIETL